MDGKRKELQMAAQSPSLAKKRRGKPSSQVLLVPTRFLIAKRKSILKENARPADAHVEQEKVATSRSIAREPVEIAREAMTPLQKGINYCGSNSNFPRPKEYDAAAPNSKTSGPPDVVAINDEPPGATCTVPAMNKVIQTAPPKAVGGGDETASVDPPLGKQRLLDDVENELGQAKNDLHVMARKLESTLEVFKEAQDAKKAAEFKQEFLENLIQKWESDLHEARTQPETTCQNLACTQDLLNKVREGKKESDLKHELLRSKNLLLTSELGKCTPDLLKKAQEGRKQADWKHELLRGEYQSLASEIEKLINDRRCLQDELVRLRKDQLLKDELTQKVRVKDQTAVMLLEMNKDSVGKNTKKLELELEEVRKDRDSKINNLQWLLEQKKGVADSNEAFICTAYKKLGETRNQLKTKDEMLVVANGELNRLKTKLEESTNLDAVCTSDVLNEAQEGRKQADLKHDLLRGEYQSLASELENVINDRRCQQKELERLREEQLLKDVATQKENVKDQSAMKHHEMDKDSVGKNTKKLELELEEVRKDRDSKINKLADLQRLFEQAKGVADFNVASTCAAHKRLRQTRDQLKTKNEMLVVANGELNRLNTELEESAKLDAACTPDLLNKAQQGRKQADLRHELLRGEYQSLVSEFEKVINDRRCQQQELVHLREEQLLKDAAMQKDHVKDQSAMKHLEMEINSVGKNKKKLELELEEVRKDRDSKINKLADVQWLLEQEKGVADSNEASMCTAHEKLSETRDQLKTKEEMLYVANGELVRLNIKLESTKVDATEFEELKRTFDDSVKRSHRVTDLLSNTMDELIAERRSRRVLEQRMEDLQADCASEKALRERTESQVERLDTELTVARTRASVSAVNQR